jgi:hypothetical protein
MSALAIGGIVFICVFGGALVGMGLGAVLPKHHLDSGSKDVIKVAMAMISTLAALVIGLLVASAKSSFDSKDAAIKRVASQAILLDRTLAKYGPETREARALLRESLKMTIRQIWPAEGTEKVDPGAISRLQGGDASQDQVLRLTPQNDEQTWLKSTALQIFQDVAAARWSVFEQLSSSIQWPFLAILIFWLVGIFVSFGLFAPRNGTVITALLASSLSVATAIYLILEMDLPYGGLVQISSAPIKSALDLLGQ